MLFLAATTVNGGGDEDDDFGDKTGDFEYMNDDDNDDYDTLLCCIAMRSFVCSFCCSPYDRLNIIANTCSCYC